MLATRQGCQSGCRLSRTPQPWGGTGQVGQWPLTPAEVQSTVNPPVLEIHELGFRCSHTCLHMCVCSHTFPPPHDTHVYSHPSWLGQHHPDSAPPSPSFPMFLTSAVAALGLEDRKSHTIVLKPTEPVSSLVPHNAPQGKMAPPTYPELTTLPPPEAFALAQLSWAGASVFLRLQHTSRCQYSGPRQ